MKSSIGRIAAAAAATLCTVMLGAVTLRAADITSAVSGDWDTPGTWNPSQVPTDADNVTIAAGHTVTINNTNTHYAGNLTIQNSGILTHAANASTEQRKVIVAIATNLTVSSGGKIDVTGKGYAGAYGPGRPTSAAGASHGGVGGYRGGTPGLAYGSVTAPTTLGSGGNSGGKYGGGAVILTVGGSATIDGDITANGLTADWYAGSGGSVFITAGSIGGNGAVTANGANANGGTGGGGRIALVATNAAGFGGLTLQAYTGVAGSADSTDGHAGTIYLSDTAGTTLLIDQNDMVPSLATLSFAYQSEGDLEFDRIILTNDGVLAVGPGASLAISNTTMLVEAGDPDEGLYVDGGTLYAAPDFTFTNYFIGVRNGATFDPATAFKIGAGAEFIVDSAHTLNCPVIVQSGGVMRHADNARTEQYKIDLTVNGSLTVASGGRIDVTGLGYDSGYGPGTAAPISNGAGHGGAGGRRNTGAIGTTYGSITAPENFGSGGSYGGYSRGGGAVKLTVSGTATIDGTVTADGAVSAYYGGAGGSVWLTADTLGGTGVLSADGGGTATTAGDGSGGGGRIAVVLTGSTGFGSLDMHAFGGPVGTTARGYGGAGTIYLQHTGHAPGNGILIVDAGDRVPSAAAESFTLQHGTAASSHAFSELVLTNGGVYGLDTNDVLDITACAIDAEVADLNDGIYLRGGTLVVPAAFTFGNYFIGVQSNATFSPATSLTIASNGTFRVDSAHTINCPVTIQAGARIDHSENSNAERYKIDLTINGNLDIQNGGAVDVDGRGYKVGYGPGYSGDTYGSAGHGGRGGPRFAHYKSGGTYGSITQPFELGSGGGYTVSYGGGAVKLTVSGTTTVNGPITANGNYADWYPGSGGSVWLTTGTLGGTNTIRANGGRAGEGQGGGGRVAVILTNANDFGDVQFEAFSSTLDPDKPGAPGTIYLQTMDQGPGKGTLLIKAHADPGFDWVTTAIGSNITDTTVGSVIITNHLGSQPIVELGTNTLTVQGDWRNYARFRANDQASVVLAGTNDAVVSGNSAFFDLTATTLGKMIRFTPGDTTTVSNALTLHGVTLYSTVDASQWFLTLDSGGSQDIKGVTVRDSNAGGGQELRAGKLGSLWSFNHGNNVNWVFERPGGTLIMMR